MLKQPVCIQKNQLNLVENIQQVNRSLCLNKDKSPQLNEATHEKAHWGNVHPHFINKQTNIPRIVISSQFYYPLTLNILLIVILCIAIPLGLCFSSNQKYLINNFQRNLYVQTNPLISVQHPLNKYQNQKLQPLSSKWKYKGIFIYIIIWSIFQLVNLVFLLFSNSGYKNYHSQSIYYKNLRNNINSIIKNTVQDKCSQLNICSICHSFVDNSVYHCQFCDICCEGFSHHCKWLGKCIGRNNKIFFKLYTLGYLFGFIGIFIFFVIVRNMTKYR